MNSNILERGGMDGISFARLAEMVGHYARLTLLYVMLHVLPQCHVMLNVIAMASFGCSGACTCFKTRSRGCCSSWLAMAPQSNALIAKLLAAEQDAETIVAAAREGRAKALREARDAAQVRCQKDKRRNRWNGVA